jgi:hypothetical protein
MDIKEIIIYETVVDEYNEIGEFQGYTVNPETGTEQFYGVYVTPYDRNIGVTRECALKDIINIAIDEGKTIFKFVFP